MKILLRSSVRERNLEYLELTPPILKNITLIFIELRIFNFNKVDQLLIKGF